MNAADRKRLGNSKGGSKTGRKGFAVLDPDHARAMAKRSHAVRRQAKQSLIRDPQLTQQKPVKSA